MRGVEAAAALAVVVLLGMTQLSTELSLRHPLRPLIQNINDEGSYLGLIMESSTHEKPLLNSGLYVPSTTFANLTLCGRTFHIGQLNGVDIIYVKTEGGSISTASTAQLLADLFNIQGFVHYGTVGSVNDTLSIGDVVVPTKVAYVGNTQWKVFILIPILSNGKSCCRVTKRSRVRILGAASCQINWQEKACPRYTLVVGPLPGPSLSGDAIQCKRTLKVGDYNLPEAGENSLGAITFLPTKLFNASGIAKNTFWLPINSAWSDVAEHLHDVELQQCLSSKKCLPKEPEIVYGLRAASSDIYLQNAALREFINTQFKVSVVDESTAMVVWVALTNDLPVVVFKGVSNTAGGSTAYSSYNYLGSVNAFNAAASFIEAIGKPSIRLMNKSY
ncbi:bark storage protein B-like [Euphorbia lathyris]|uniref:bark storage protein B-like n=1 Tax=Euphorbia lathyris TaxID=212925 RepID=UPI0033135EB8